jgi:hypothetical protein
MKILQKLSYNIQNHLHAHYYFLWRRKHGFFHMCVGYCGLNKITIKIWYPLLTISRLFEQLDQIRIFIKIDLKGVNNCVHIKGDEWKITLCIKYGHFKYNAMPFGPKNALVIFQHMMNDIFRKFLNDFMVIYLNDILIFSKNLEEHEKHVCLVLNKIQIK